MKTNTNKNGSGGILLYILFKTMEKIQKKSKNRERI